MQFVTLNFLYPYNEIQQNKTKVYKGGPMDSRQERLLEGVDEDRISGLPDEILCLVLSFLPTLYAV